MPGYGLPSDCSLIAKNIMDTTNAMFVLKTAAHFARYVRGI